MATGRDYSFKSRSFSRSTCKFPGCNKPRYTESYGFEHEFCGRTHANEYKIKYGHHFPSSHVSSVTSAAGSSKRVKGPLKALPTPLYNSPSTGSKDVIKFYNRDEPYYEFTNFYRGAPIVVDGKKWPTTEHYFQAQKFVGTPYVEVIRNLPTAREAFQISRSPVVSRWQRKDWALVKDDIMLLALRCKFVQHNHLRRKLLETGNKRLIEHTSNDSYWGDGGDESGRNKLGELLMQVRQELGGGKEKEQEQRPSLRRSASFSVGAGASGLTYDTSKDDSYGYRERIPPKSPMRRSSSFSNLTRLSQHSASTSVTRPSSYKPSGRPEKTTTWYPSSTSTPSQTNSKMSSTTHQDSQSRVNRTSSISHPRSSSCLHFSMPRLFSSSSRRQSDITKSSQPHDIITHQPKKNYSSYSPYY